MAVDRPTFSESWYRLAGIRPRLRSTVQVHRQHFRGQMWHVLQDPASNQYFRLNIPAYRFVGLLDGQRTVSDVWRICNEQLGDQAPTQGEAIQLLGQLYSSNLIQAEMPPDAEGLFERYRKRRAREIKSYLTNLLFIRIPLIDPDSFLDRWVGVFGKFFSIFGFGLWMVLVATALYFLAGRAAELVVQSKNILDPAKLPVMYMSIIGVKILHEFGHAFACKRFGQLAGGRGEVHVMGVMFLVFAPLPYVDASSAWAFRSKWRRVVVGMGGMFVELAIAAVAAIVWAHTESGPVHAICYNIIFIAGVSTILFNANPLLRYDGYYILSDLLEIPNLSQRSKDYLYYLVKKYVFGVRRPRSPAHSGGERVWFVIYGIASTVYRVFILAMILLFITERLPEEFKIVALGFAVVSAVLWLCVPIGKFIRYLATSQELHRVRPRALTATFIFLAAVIVGIGMIETPDHHRAEGIVVPVRMTVIHAEVDGFQDAFLETGQLVGRDGEPLVSLYNHELNVQSRQLRSELVKLRAEWRLAGEKKEKDPKNALDHEAEQEAKANEIARQKLRIWDVDKKIALLQRRSPLAGTWIAPQIAQTSGRYLQKGEQIAIVADLNDLIIEAVVNQQVSGMIDSAARVVEVRLKGQPDMEFTGSFEKLPFSGKDRLPSAALGYAAGGAMQVTPDDRQGTKTSEKFFQIIVHPDKGSIVPLRSGQRVIVRFTMPPKPLAVQWWRSLRQLLQRRFGI